VASAFRGVPVYPSAFADTKLYCLATEATEGEKLAEGFFGAAAGVERAST